LLKFAVRFFLINRELWGSKAGVIPEPTNGIQEIQLLDFLHQRDDITMTVTAVTFIELNTRPDDKAPLTLAVLIAAARTSMPLVSATLLPIRKAPNFFGYLNNVAVIF
jgi:hypothetical protein